MIRIRKFNNKYTEITNGWLTKNGEFYICEFGGHSGLLRALRKEGIIDNNEPLVKLGYYSEGIRKYESAYFNVDKTLQLKLTPCQLSFFFENFDKLKPKMIELILDFIKETDRASYSDFLYYLKFR